VKRLDSTITGLFQGQRELKEFHRGWGAADWADPATIRDHILKLKIWTSEYGFELDLDELDLEDITDPSIFLPFFLVGENKFCVFLKKNEGGEKYDLLFEEFDSAISSKIYFQVDLFKRLDNDLVKSDKCECSFKTDIVEGFVD
jgi:hypothetical protein